MINIDIKKLKNIEDELTSLEDDEVIYVDNNEETEYVIMTKALYDSMEDLAELVTDAQNQQPVVRIVGPEQKLELSYDEYEKVKNQMLDALEKTLKPNPEKLN